MARPNEVRAPRSWARPEWSSGTMDPLLAVTLGLGAPLACNCSQQDVSIPRRKHETSRSMGNVERRTRRPGHDVDRHTQRGDATIRADEHPPGAWHRHVTRDHPAEV